MVDTEAQVELAQAFGISSIPTLMAVRDGVVLYVQPGALPATALEQLIEQVRSVDMDDVSASSPSRPPPEPSPATPKTRKSVHDHTPIRPEDPAEGRGQRRCCTQAGPHTVEQPA
jgi:predicted transcriptional regulator